MSLSNFLYPDTQTEKANFFPVNVFFPLGSLCPHTEKKQLFPGDFFCPLGKTQENKLFPHEQKYIFSLSSLNRKKKMSI